MRFSVLTESEPVPGTDDRAHRGHQPPKVGELGEIHILSSGTDTLSQSMFMEHFVDVVLRN